MSNPLTSQAEGMLSKTLISNSSCINKGTILRLYLEPQRKSLFLVLYIWI